MRLLGAEWTAETADSWTKHDLIASILSAFVFLATALGGAWAIVGRLDGWLLLAAALGASLLLYAVIERKLKAQSIAFERHEEEHLEVVEERQRWGA